VEDRLFITVWYRVSATLTSRMKGCRAALCEPAAAGVRVAGRGTGRRGGMSEGLGLNGDERELRRGCLQFPSNFVGNIVTPRSYHLVYGLIPSGCRSTLPPSRSSTAILLSRPAERPALPFPSHPLVRLTIDHAGDATFIRGLRSAPRLVRLSIRRASNFRARFSTRVRTRSDRNEIGDFNSRTLSCE